MPLLKDKGPKTPTLTANYPLDLMADFWAR